MIHFNYPDYLLRKYLGYDLGGQVASQTMSGSKGYNIYIYIYIHIHIGYGGSGVQQYVNTPIPFTHTYIYIYNICICTNIVLTMAPIITNHV